MYHEVVPLNPCDYSVIDGRVMLKASARTDFIRKRGSAIRDNAAFCCVPRNGDFTLSARVTVQGQALRDAAFLMVRQDEKRWIQLGLQREADGRFRIVSRRTDGWSEDTLSQVGVENGCYLRIVRRGDTFLVSFSPDSLTWMPLESFDLPLEQRVAVGFGAQSPLGSGCEVTVGDMTIADAAVTDFSDQD